MGIIKQLVKLRSVKHDFIFLLIIVVLSSIYYGSVLDKGPLNTHLWRQTDCLSLTYHYANGANFFKPETHLLLADNKTSGRSAGEFPILYFIVGMLWKLFGESYLIFRLFYLLILLSGLYSFYKSLHILLNDSYWATIFSLLLFTSPVYVFYGISFLTDVPAMSFVLIAIYFLLQYHRKKAMKLFFISMGFFALAGLIKISSLIAFIFLFMIFILELFSIKSLGNRKLFKCNKYEWIGFISVILSVFSWYYYAHYYNNLHGFKYTINTIFPLWQIPENEVTAFIYGIENFTIKVFFSKPMLYVLVFIGIMNLTLYKKIPLFAFLSNIIINLGALLYFILWGRALGVHDYYYSALLILFIGILVPFIWFIKANYPNLLKNSRLKIFLSIFLIYNLLYCFNVTKLKTSSSLATVSRLLVNISFVDLMNWTNMDVSTNWNRYREMKPYIREIGINEDDKIISLPDHSSNRSLFLINQKGWTDYRYFSKSEEIEELIQKGARYLFIADQESLKKEYLAPFLTEQIGDYKGVKIFKLSENMMVNE